MAKRGRRHHAGSTCRWTASSRNGTPGRPAASPVAAAGSPGCAAACTMQRTAGSHAKVRCGRAVYAAQIPATTIRTAWSATGPTGRGAPRSSRSRDSGSARWCRRQWVAGCNAPTLWRRRSAVRRSRRPWIVSSRSGRSGRIAAGPAMADSRSRCGMWQRVPSTGAPALKPTSAIFAPAARSPALDPSRKARPATSRSGQSGRIAPSSAGRGCSTGSASGWIGPAHSKAALRKSAAASLRTARSPTVIGAVGKAGALARPLAVGARSGGTAW
mmetsp:Transcript_71531/g.152868  ORF Transcript_71531/g.152868 Transcript_71531/m.152868 type:complete len:272 (-) Transcript_71531:4172-4987(-)